MAQENQRNEPRAGACGDGMGDGLTIEKTCTRCHKIKNLDEYHVNNKRPDLRARWCKQCFIDHRHERSAEYKREKELKRAKRSEYSVKEGEGNE